MGPDKPTNAVDSTPTNPFFQPSAEAASLKMVSEARDSVIPLPKPTDLPITSGADRFSDKIAGGDKFPDTKIDGALLLADTKFKPSDSMSAKKADDAFEAMMAGNGRKSNVQSLDAYTQVDLRLRKVG